MIYFIALNDVTCDECNYTQSLNKLGSTTTVICLNCKHVDICAGEDIKQFHEINENYIKRFNFVEINRKIYNFLNKL